MDQALRINDVESIWCQLMRNSKTTNAFGIGMIAGSVPCTLACVMVWRLTVALEEGRAAGRDAGFDAIGVVMMWYVAFLLAVASCAVGLVYFGYWGLLKRKLVLQPWQRLGIAYSIVQLGLVGLYIATR